MKDSSEEPSIATTVGHHTVTHLCGGCVDSGKRKLPVLKYRMNRPISESILARTWDQATVIIV